jgi:predicted flap endonuclease-1-like 5' DNA nuclease
MIIAFLKWLVGLLLKLLGESPAKAAQPPAAPTESPAVAMPATKPQKTPVLPPDDFQKILGLGPKSESALYAAQITRYGQLAELSNAQLESILLAAGVRLVASAEAWAAQAKLLAANDLAGLRTLQDQLRAR